MKYIFPFSVVSLVHNSTTVISLEIWIPRGKLYSSSRQEKHKQSILQSPSSRPESVLLRNRCPPTDLVGNSNTSKRPSVCLLLEKMASSEPPDSQTNHPVLRVAYDYEYDYKTRKVSIKQGELLHLLQKTNEHWWKVMRPIVNKPFFVPAIYVFPLDDKNRNEIGNESHASIAFSNNNKSSSPRSTNSNNNNQNPAEADKGESSVRDNDVGRANESAYLKASAKTSKINRNEATRASHRDRAQSKLSSSSTKISSSLAKLKNKNWSASLEELSKQIVFPGLSSESVADLTAVTRDSVLDSNKFLSVGENEISKDSSPISSSRSKSESINKCLSFRNPSFNNHVDSGNVEPKQKESSNLQNSTEALQTQNVKTMECTVSRSGTINRNSKPPPLPKNSPVRVLPDNWGEYYTDSGRYFYYNEQTKITSWKPPRNSSTKKSDEHLGSSLSDASAHASSFEMSSENIPDFVGSTNPTLDAVSHEIDRYRRRDSITETRGSLSGRSKNLSTESVSSKTQQSEDESNPADVYPTNNIAIRVPDGWESLWDDVSQQICYVNKITGARRIGPNNSSDKMAGANRNRATIAVLSSVSVRRSMSESDLQLQGVAKLIKSVVDTNQKWFTSTDTQERIYFYEENSSNSSWYLPGSAQIGETQRSASRSLETDSPDEFEVLPEHSAIPKSGNVKKRHSAGEVIDRKLKAKSLIIPTDLKKYGSSPDKSCSLPRSTKLSIWTNSKPIVLREGCLCRTKITEHGKKVRKSWGISYAVLTESHLSLFKDQKSFKILTKTEVEMELEGASAEWTEDKSSRKNVFQLNTLSDLQMLFQLDDKDSAVEWFDDIRSVTEKSNPTLRLDISMRLRESPENLLDPLIGERKISSRLYRNKSTKVRITSSSDTGGAEKNEIRARLKKFFNRRPPRESLVKKGIYKDESVFGCSLEKLCALEKRDVPRFVEECILAIDSKEENLKTDGIYRASGNLSQVQKIRLQVDQNNMACLLEEDDVHVLAGCLKLFFRELKEPLIPYDLFEKTLMACNAQNKKDKVNKFREIVKHLAKPNKCTLQALLSHLLKVAALADFNRMQIPNLAIVFGPTLMWPAVESQNMALDLMQQNIVIEALLVEYDSIFQ